MGYTKTMASYVELGSLIVALFILYLLIVFVRDPVTIIINSLIAIGVLFLLNVLFNLGIPINVVTVGIVAIGGLVGLLLVLALHFLRIAF